MFNYRGFRVLLIIGLALAWPSESHHSSAQEKAASGDHPRIEASPRISDAEAEQIYSRLKDAMRERYALARIELAENYQTWHRYNDAPYLSKAHGNRYLNNFANTDRFDFASPRAGAEYPVGTVIAKDSFTVTQSGKVFPGSLFIMEKLPGGRNPETADWRYVAIHPDGSMEGDTIGDMPDGVKYCHQCHQHRAEFDYLFGIE